MPEIAEIALTSEILLNYLKNKTLIDIEILSGRYSKNLPVGYDKFKKSLPLKVIDINSRGKFLWFELSNKLSENKKYGSKTEKKNYISKKENKTWYIWNTFGLTGEWYIDSKKKMNHCRIILHFKNGLKAYYSDMRNFGTFKFSTDKKEFDKKIKSLSPDFLKDDNFNLGRIKKMKIPIVKILMDQKRIGSGIGNYLVAEILYRAKISPKRLGSSLSDDDLKNLEYWIKYTIKLSYVDNHTGYMKNLEKESDKLKKKNYHPDIKLKEKTFKFLVYGKKFDKYNNPVKKDKIVGNGKNMRTTHWVPAVQK